MDFQTKLSGHDVTITDKTIKYNHDIHGAFIIDWQFYTEMRDWGVKSVGVYATKVVGDITISNWEDDTEQTIEAFFQNDWLIDTEVDDLKLGNCITPQHLDVDYDNKVLTVNF